ncbi:hypothetical protein H5410_049682 [Solanum commersonii]|uniref:HTH cro/C1-type domain-containing protein n=1 Tax=Solanum commersonii TaxID=4109 RepID=A0A9J5WUS3_SOLCO|nr:hypothetical protein H5410_049682 [Solanum commersonii]
MSGISQDWEPVVIRKKAPTSAARKDEKAVNAARRSGAEIETVKKCFVPIPVPKSHVLAFVISWNRLMVISCSLDTFFSNAANAGSNRAASSSTSLNTRKLDEDTENLSHEKVPTELKKAIMQARQDKKLTQSQLAQLINEKPQIIQEYESGKAIPKPTDNLKTGESSWSETSRKEIKCERTSEPYGLSLSV